MFDFYSYFNITSAAANSLNSSVGKPIQSYDGYVSGDAYTTSADASLKNSTSAISYTGNWNVASIMSEKEGGLKIYDAHKDKAIEAFEIIHPKAHWWKIQGEQVEKEYALINLSTDEGIKKLIDYLDKIGVEDELKEKGAQAGDTVSIGEFDFEYSE